MGTAEAHTKKVGASSQDLSKTLTGLFTLALAKQVSNYIGEIVSLGNQANATEARFRAFSSTMGDFEAIMQGLRKATLGVVTDMDLQAGAMLLVQTTGIKTTDELERMMNIITLTKKPAEDMTSAIQNFSLMLANNSILRLDSFGISSSVVRARILELKDTVEGMDRSTAFRMAVMEEAEKNIQRLGPAAEAAGTAMARLETRVSNAFQNIAQSAAQGAQGFALAIEFMLGLTPQQEAHAQQVATDTAITLAMDLQAAFDAAMQQMPESDAQFIGTFVQNALESAKTNPELLSDMNRFTEFILGQMNIEPNSVNLSTRFSLADVAAQTLQIQHARESERAVAAEIMAIQQQTAEADAKRLALQEMSASYAEDQWHMMERAMDTGIRMNTIEEQAMLRKKATLEAITAGMGAQASGMFKAAFAMNPNAGSSNQVPEYISREQEMQMQGLAEQANMLANNMERLAETNEGMFTEEEVERVRTWADNLQGMADAGSEAADAFEKMSLADQFGKGEGGRLGEGLDGIVDALERMGVATAELENAQRSFDLRSGRETWSSLAFADQITMQGAQVYQQQGADAATAFMQSFTNVMDSATLMGIDVNTPEFISKLTSTFSTGFNAQSFDLAGFLQPFSPAAQHAADMEASMGVIAEDGSLIKDPIAFWGDTMADISTDTQATEQAISKTKTALDAMSQKTYVLQIQPEFVNIPALITMLLPGLVALVQGNGGVTPGTDPRASVSRPVTPVRR